MVKIYIVSRDDTVVFLCGICSLPEKMTLFFSILNKWLSTVARYLEVFCRIIEYLAMCTSFDFIYCMRTHKSLENEPVLISGKIIWGKKKQSPMRINVLCKSGQPMSKSWRRGEKEHLFYRTSPSGCFWIWRLLELKRVDVRLENKKIKFFIHTFKKTLIIL